MQLYYFHDPNLNFGDDLNPWIWQRVLPNFFDDDPNSLFIGIGTLLNHRIPFARHRIVFGSGYGYGEPPRPDGIWNFVCVRGPLTAAKLSLSKHCAIVDPAVLIHQLFPYRNQNKIYPVAFMPHCASASMGNWELICKIANIKYIDPRQSVEKVMTDIASSELLLAEAMHGAIAAEAFRVPWIALSCYDHISTFKWRDWCESLSLVYKPVSVQGVYRGDQNELSSIRFKNIVKRVLHHGRIWSPNWQLPPPRRSSAEQHDQAANALIRISKETSPMRSSEYIFQQKLDQINQKLKYVRDMT